MIGRGGVELNSFGHHHLANNALILASYRCRLHVEHMQDTIGHCYVNPTYLSTEI